MPQISEFILNLSHVDSLALRDQTGDLVIAETGLDSKNGQTFFSSDIDMLQEQGRIFIGYLNVAVTDHNRDYWDDAWVSFTDPDNKDVGTINVGAPDWLRDSHGYAGDNNGTVFGRIVDYAHLDWQQRLIDMAVLMVTSPDQGGLGSDGVFLDDVGRYYEAVGASYSVAQAAQDMITLVNAIADAVRVVNSDAYIAVNSGAYIGWDSGEATSVATTAYFANIDALLMESQYGAAWIDVLQNTTHWVPGHDFLAVENGDSPALAAQAFADWARDNGVVPHVAADNSYSDPAITPPSGSAAADALAGGDGPNDIRGLAGADIISGAGGNDTISGNRGNDEIYGDAGADLIFGLEGRDTLRGGSGDDFIRGGSGQDVIFGNWGRDILLGGNQHDYLLGQKGNDRVFGGADADTVNGGLGDDTVAGGGGNDTVVGEAGNDRMFGNEGEDHMVGGGGDDTVEGHAGDDNLNGKSGNDLLRGGLGDDFLFGGLGNDTIVGGEGNDTVNGELGADSFVFFGLVIGADTITDFTTGTDVLRLDNALWAEMMMAPLSEAQVVSMFGDDSSGTLIFDFGSGNTITLDGVLSATGFASDIDIF